MECGKQAKATRILSFMFLMFTIIVAASLVIGCSNPVSSMQKEFDDNPMLKARGLAVKVTEFKDGYVKITITKGLMGIEPQAVNSEHRIRHYATENLRALTDAENILKKRFPEIKDVMWYAK